MKTVLISGINGFTGKYVEELLLSQGYKVVGLVFSEPRDNQIQCDLTNKESVRSCLEMVRPDYIINLAALSFVGHSDQKAFYDVNVFGALNLLEVAYELKLDIKKIILASSANIYGTPENVSKIGEEQSPSPMNHYAMSKLSMEYMCNLWNDKLPIIITRPFNYTGIGQADNFLIPKIVNHFKNNKKVIELGNIDVSRDFSDVRDIAKAYVNLLESDVIGETVNLCSGNIYSLSEIIAIMNEIAGYEIEVAINPLFVRPNEIKILGGNNNKLTNLVGFKPDIKLEQTLLDMYNEKNSD